MRKFVLLLSALLFLLAMAGCAQAIMIVPARTNIEYQPGEIIQLSFGVGQFGEGMGYEVDFQGEYTENARIIKEDSNSILVEFTMPENARPGQHELKVGVAQAQKGGFRTDAISARAAVYSQVRFFVPYPARYAEISIDDVDIAIGKMAFFTVNLHNYGKEMLNSIKGNVSIFDNLNQTIAIVPLSDRSSLYSLQATELFAQWGSENSSAGIYRTVAQVDYDGIDATTEGQLRVGTMTININSIRAIGNVQSGIVKINVDLSSLWNEKLTGVYVTGEITKDGAVMANMKSATTELQSWDSTTLVMYWDVLNLDVGIYDIDVKLYYADKVKETETQIYLMEEEAISEDTTVNTMLYGAVLLLILAVIFLAVVVLKTKKGDSDE